MTLISIKAGNHTVTGKLAKVDSCNSRYTGNPLTIWNVEFEFNGEEQRQLMQDFIESDQAVETDAGTSSMKSWRIGEHHTSYNVGSGRNTFHWELVESEKVSAEKLIINGLELTPYKYTEEFGANDVLEITARVEISEEAREQLNALPEYFQVIRKGVNDTPREMRFGQMLWSQDKDKYRYQLIILDKAVDSRGRRGLFEPQHSNEVIRAVETKISLSNLISSLVKKNILLQTEADQILAPSDQAVDKELTNNDRVKDLDAWLKQAGQE